jgi:hypothetical protein
MEKQKEAKKNFLEAFKQVEEQDGKPYAISIEEQFKTWYKRLGPQGLAPADDILFETSMRNSYYSGAAEMGFILTALAEEGRPGSGQVVDDLFVEIKTYFESAIDGDIVVK